jgi:diaminopimelate decarboxylase
LEILDRNDYLGDNFGSSEATNFIKKYQVMSIMEKLSFISADQVRQVQKQYGTPVFVYDQKTLEAQAEKALAFPNAFGLTARYAMKSCPNAAVIRILNSAGLHIDASSGYEARRAMRAGVPAEQIQITAQQLPDDLQELVKEGVLFNACSLHQLRSYGQLCKGGEISVRVNPGLGSGHSNRTNVGGPSSSFGIWHEYLDQVKDIAREFDLRLTGLHSHIGSGSDPAVWQKCARLTLDVAAHLPAVERVSLGGGFKVGRMQGEKSTDLQEAGKPIVGEFERFAKEHGRQLHLEIEPGTFFVANAGALIATIIDVVDTGAEGYRFLKVDSGMTEVLRPSLYGAQHPITVVASDEDERGTAEYLIAGHCCESGDVLTPAPDNPEGLQTRQLIEAKIGDAVFIGGSGAYCAGMAAKNYNSFPEAPEVLLAADGTLHLTRQRQSLDQVLSNEQLPDFLTV